MTDTLREELEGAFEEEEKNLETEEETETETSEEEGETDSTEEGETDDSNDSDDGDAGDDDDPAPAKEPDASPDTPDTAIGGGLKAPVGYSAESREVWKNTPKAVQEQIHKREVEIASAMQGTSEARKTHQAINQLASSYAPILAAEGADTPMAAIETMFQTVAQLRVGSPQQKAQKMAQLISDYGVDINTLDAALAGVDPQQQDPNYGVQQAIDAKLNPIIQHFEAQQQQQRDAAQQGVNTQVKKFADNAEFINEVRMDMADLLDLASMQSREMTIEDAYAKAVAMRPELQKILNDRSLIGRNKAVAGKRNAGSSIASRGSNATSQNHKPTDLRGEIEALWDGYQ